MRAAIAVTGAIAVGATLAACSARKPYGAEPTRTMIDVHDSRGRITALANEIRQWRLDAGLADEPATDAVVAMSTLPASEVAATCRGPNPTSGTCGDVCTLGDSICDNAQAICELADQLDGDAWARGKCDSAKASCHEAAERCCACRPTVLP